MPAALLAAVLTLAEGCSSAKRPPQTPQQMLAMRADADQREIEWSRQALKRAMEGMKARSDEHADRRSATTAPVFDILIISGGGDWGAFGAGFLKGWSKVPASDALAKPDFAIVTGVSTGALIAPFAFLGDEESTDRILRLY